MANRCEGSVAPLLNNKSDDPQIIIGFENELVIGGGGHDPAVEEFEEN